jgi:hypothetical protein
LFPARRAGRTKKQICKYFVPAATEVKAIETILISEQGKEGSD